jgi:hypothetical protein
MDRRDDIEFLAADGRVLAEVDPADDDEIAVGRLQVPRWLVGVGIAVAVAAVIVAIAAQGPPKQVTAPEPELVSVVAVPSAPPTSRLGEPLPVGDERVSDALIAGEWFYTLQLKHLTATTPVIGIAPTYDRPRRISVEGFDLAEHADARLVLDTSAHRIWVVVQDVPDGQLIEYDAYSLIQLRASSWPEPINAAAALDGHLYLTTASGVVDFAPGNADPALLPMLQADTGSVAADPHRHRLLLLSNRASRVRIYRPGNGVSQAQASVPIDNGVLGVTGEGSIWVGGFGEHGAVLVRLDPVRLGPMTFSPLSDQLGARAMVEAVGTSSVWVRSGRGGYGLWCVDAHTGVQRQFWADVPGNVTSQAGYAYLASGSVIRPLVLDECSG